MCPDFKVSEVGRPVNINILIANDEYLTNPLRDLNE